MLTLIALRIESCYFKRRDSINNAEDAVVKGDTAPAALPAQAQIDILLEEYRALYSLAMLRLNALEKRAPVIGAALTGVLSAVASLESVAQLIVLAALPPTVLWYLYGTITHARSFEDALRAIERIENTVNALAGEVLMGFQSQHPSRGKHVGGRTGSTTVWAVVTASFALLAMCVMMWQTMGLPGIEVYVLAITFDAVLCLELARRYITYRYQPELDH